MFSSTKRLIFTLIMGAVVLNSCVKEITDDLDNLQTADDTQDWIFPFINSDIQLEDLDSTNIKVYPDGTVYYTSLVDSVMVIDAENIFNLPSTQQVSVQPYLFAGVNTAPYSGTKLSTLQAALSNDPILWSTLSPLNGSTTVVPPFSSNNLGVQVFPPFSTFDNINYDNGLLDVTISNASNIPLSNVIIRVSNFNGASLGVLVYSNIAAGSSATQQIGMGGKTIKSLIQYEILTLESPGSSTPILADFSSPLVVEVSSTSDMEVNTALADFNDPIFDFTFFYELKDDLGAPLEQELSEIKIESGTLQYIITSDLSSAIELNGEIIGSTGPPNGGPQTLTHNFPGLTPFTVNDVLPLDGFTYDLTQDGFNPYNRIPIKFSPKHIFTTGFNKFDKTDVFTITFLANDVEFEYVKGKFGLDTVAIPQNTVDWSDDDVFNHVSGNVEFENAKINFITHTNIGIDFNANILGYVEDINSNTLNMQLNQELEASGSTVPDFGNSVVDEFTYDQTNSNADEILSFLPYSMTTAGLLYVNKNNPNRECYFNNEAFLIADVELETPLHLMADTLFFTDTVTYENEDFDDLRDIDTSKFINSMFLHMYIENDFPINIGTTISIIDSVDETTDTLMRVLNYEDVIDAAKVDANGETIESTKYKTIIELSKEDRIALVNGDKVLVKVNLLTSKYNSTTPFVKFKSDDHFKLNLSVEVQNHIPVE